MEILPHKQESEDEGSADKTLTEDSDTEQQGTGIALPGHHQPLPLRDTLHHPNPSHSVNQTRQLREEGKVAWEERCDEFADDLRRQDVLQNKAKYW